MTVTPIVALDVSTVDDAIRIVRQLGESCTFYKIGSELFTATGPQIVTMVREAGAHVFLDLKFHDIPNTVRKAAASAARSGASLITVHASGGADMVRAAVEGAGSGCEVFAVTVLTSFDAVGLGTAWGRDEVDILSEVHRLAEIARGAGAAGVVCSGHEAEALHDRFGGALKLLVPGIRLPGSSHDDQARVVTPAAAAQAGASYVILGRTVTGAPDPVAAMQAATLSLASASL